jgi:hypothetical protein
MDKHIQLIGILWIVYGGLTLLAGIVGFLLLFGISMFPDIQTGAPTILRLVALAVIFFVALLGVPKIIGGVWLLKRKEWSRILILVLSFLSLLNFPLGTALGVYSLVILLNQDTIRLFDVPAPETSLQEKPVSRKKAEKSE